MHKSLNSNVVRSRKDCYAKRNEFISERRSNTHNKFIFIGFHNINLSIVPHFHEISYSLRNNETTFVITLKIPVPISANFQVLLYLYRPR